MLLVACLWSLASFIMALVLFLSLSNVYAHKPLQAESEDNNRLLDAVHIPDHKVSYAIHQEINDRGEVDYYSFDAKEGDELYVEMTIPKLAGLESFTPSIALIGHGINSELLERHDNNNDNNISISKVEINPDPHGNRNYDDAFPSQVPANTGAIIVITYNGTIPSTEFFEPFTQTSYWERQKLIVDELPSSGRYYLAVFDGQRDVQGYNSNNDDDAVAVTKKYTLAVGKIEDFTATDYVVTLPVAWFNTKLFFNDYVTPLIVIILMIAIPSSIVTFLHIHRSRRC